MKPRSVLAQEPNCPLVIGEVDLDGLNADLLRIGRAGVGEEILSRAVPSGDGPPGGGSGMVRPLAAGAGAHSFPECR